MIPRTRRKLTWLLGVLAILASAAAYEMLPYWLSDQEAEATELMQILRIGAGATVAEVGAGAGRMTVAAARVVGPSGRVFSTELDDGRLNSIREAVEEAGLANVTVIEAGERETSLPEQCCDAIFMRRVYHHFGDPVSLNGSLFAALKPGGRLAVIDFVSRPWLPRPADVPNDRDGHGMPPDLLIAELSEAGFVVVERIDAWPGRNYCVIARKPLTVENDSASRETADP